MAAHPERLLRHLRRLVIAPSSDPATDAGLLDRFVRCNDEDAFATLVARHGPMVFGVCRRVLRDAHQAEDVAQATFLVLASKARTIRRADALAAWLHRTAQHLALKSRRSDTCRRQREMRSYLAFADTSQPDPLDELTVRELLAIFDEELQRLRTAYRLPLILCCLEGQTQEKAARQLGWSPGAVKGRLERGRAQLHRRLVKRGVSLSAMLVALEGLQGTSSALGMPPGFITATLAAAARFVATTRNADATIAARALTLADEAVRGMAVAKTKIMLALLLMVGVTLAVVGALTRQGLAARQEEDRQADEPQLRSEAVEQRKPVNEKHQARAERLADTLPDGALTRLGTLRWRVPGEVASIAFAPNGKVVAIASLGDARNHGLYFFDAANGKLTQHIGLADTFFARIAFSPDGRRLACTCTVEADDRHKNMVQIWQWPDGRKIREFDGAGLQWLGWSADGEPLGIFLANGAVLLRKLAGNEHQFEAKDLPDHGRDLGRCAYAAGGKILAVPDERAIIHVWDTATGKERCALQAKGDYVRSVPSLRMGAPWPR
jgi:RNA polymerase sigma factor (sigma-70 family)